MPPTDAPVSKSKFARSFWDAATQIGTPNATTTFHETYDKTDVQHQVDGSPYTGQRAMALGFLTKRRLVRFLQSDKGASLTGIDCTRPGLSAVREQRIRQVASEFLDLLVEFTHKYEVVAFDAEAVAEARGMVVGTFCLFRGFSRTIVSSNFAALKSKWQAAQLADASIDPPVASVPVAVSTVASNVVEVAQISAKRQRDA